MQIKDEFFALSTALNNRLQSDEILLCSFHGENSDFVRLNNNRIRQAGSVCQYEFSMQLIKGKHHCSAVCNISGQQKMDIQRLSKLLNQLREQNQHNPEDPYLNYNTLISNTDKESENQLPDSQQIIKQLIDTADGLDLVGIYASGTLFHGFANSIGQQNWQTTHQFNLDWSCFLNTDKAVKSQYSGSLWRQDVLEQKFDSIHKELDLISKPSISLNPGNYRCYLSPTALSSILEIVCWGGFGLKSHHSKSSPLIKLNQGSTQLDSRVTIIENHLNGFAPGFSDQGFINHDQVKLINQGVREDYLINPRSAIEYDNPVNAPSESPQSLSLSSGKLKPVDRIAAIDKGLYINNLWYTNFSDHSNCQITGMTRFACFYIENGIVKAPIDVMRFDQSIYQILGSNLLELDQQTEILASTDTYERRSTSSMSLPGILINDFRLSF